MPAISVSAIRLFHFRYHFQVNIFSLLHNLRLSGSDKIESVRNLYHVYPMCKMLTHLIDINSRCRNFLNISKVGVN